MYEQVKEIFDRTMAAARVGLPCRDLQQMTLDYFEAKGHPTARTHPGGHDGYVHSLGHGVGLDVHEEPRLSVAAGNATHCWRRGTSSASSRGCTTRNAATACASRTRSRWSRRTAACST
jgi:Xaa-Pro aminopeptidase